LGQPDRVAQMPSKFAVPADGPDRFRCFVIPLNLEKDAYLHALEFRAGNRRTVHHALVFLDNSGQARKLAEASADGGYTCFGGPGVPANLIGGWAPGITPRKPVADYATALTKDSDLVLQVHYHPSGAAAQDQSSLGLFFGDPPTRGRSVMLMGSIRIDIPPGESHYVVKATRVLPADAELLGITPHAHYLCKDMKVTAHLPDGSETPLIWIKDWDFNWQGAYTYASPMKLPKGTRVDMEFTYDNSANNPRNPVNPPVEVKYGEQTTNEMAFVFLSFGLPTPAEAAAFTKGPFGAR
jgi:hypothetical protein